MTTLTFAPVGALAAADILVLDAAAQPLLVGESKATGKMPEAGRQQLEHLMSAIPAPYALLADLSSIRIFERDGLSGAPLLEVPTAEILRHYDPDYDSKRIFDYYLEKLVAAWLDDLNSHWKHQSPPCESQLSEIGLLDALAGGTVLTEARWPTRDRTPRNGSA